MNERRAIPAPGGHVAIEGVGAGVELAADVPAVERSGRVVEDALGRGDPVDEGSRLAPESGGIGKTPRVRDLSGIGRQVV